MIVIGEYNYCTADVSRLIVIITVVHAYFVLPTWAIDINHSENYDTNTFNWTDDEDDEDDETDDLPPVLVDDIVSAGKMVAFFEKLNSLRKQHRKDRSKSADHYSLQQPFGLNRGGTNKYYMHHAVPVGTESLDEAVAAMDYTAIEVGNSGVIETRDKSATSITTSGKEAVSMVTNNDYYYEAQTTKTNLGGYVLLDSDRLLVLQGNAAVWYLHMGLRSVKCLWRQYREATTEQETLAVRDRFNSFVRFWTLVVAVSVVALWSFFGYFHELFCFCVISPPADYAKDVNRYLMMVPPHVVVTNKGKMFKYQPTAEERFLWESAKRIANFKI